MVKTVVGVMGASPFGLTSTMSNAKQLETFLKVCSKYGVKEIDTARFYADGESERILGEIEAYKDFEISTKIGMPKEGQSLTHDKILKSSNESLQHLKNDQIDIFYIHMPDRKTPFEETLGAINEVYKQGKFKRFGICNYRADEVQTIYDICKKNDYILPTVYQGGYNAVSRSGEKELFPLLRKLNISFYGFGPTGGGLLAKSLKELREPKKGSRWDNLPFLKQRYGKEEIFQVIEKIHDQCQLEKISVLESCLRWEKHHSALQDQDAVLLGASSEQQIEQNLQAMQKGPLPDNLVKAYDELWQVVENDPPPYHV